MKIKKSNLKILWGDKDFFASLSLMLVCLFLFYFFPSQGYLQMISKGVVFLIIVPALYVKFILKKTLGQYGLKFSLNRGEFLWLVSSFLITFAFIFLLIAFTPFKENYFNSFSDYIIDSFWFFLLYELVFVGFGMIFLDAFFKGFVLFSLSPKTGHLSILASFFLFSLFFLFTKSFTWGNSLILILALTGSLASYKTRSFVYSYLMGLLAIIATDAYLIYSIKQII